MSGFRRPWAALLPMLAALAAAGAPLSSPRAEDFTFAERSIRLTVPGGWCRLDPAKPADAPVIQRAEQLQQGINHVVLVFADCQQLGALHSGNLHGYLTNGAIMIPLQRGRIVTASFATRAEFIASIAREIGAIDVEKIRAELRERFARAGATGIDIDGAKSLGVLKQDEYGIYPGFMLPAPPQMTVKSLVGATAITMINRLPVSVSIWRPAISAGTLDGILGEEREILRGLIAANAAIEAAAPQPAPGSFASGIDWNQVLRKGFMGAIIGGLIAGLGYAAKRWRGREADQG
jgi:hypothetical protein